MFWIIFRLQNSSYFCVFKYARAVKQKVWNKAENRERDWGETPYGRVRLVRFARVRLLRHALPILAPSTMWNFHAAQKQTTNFLPDPLTFFQIVLFYLGGRGKGRERGLGIWSPQFRHLFIYSVSTTLH